MAKTHDKLADLERRREQLEVRIQRERAKRRQAQRKADTRRKVIIGGALLAAVKNGLATQAELDRLLDRLVTSERDRVTLGLPPRGGA